jgi:hypothetical protein
MPKRWFSEPSWPGCHGLALALFGACGEHRPRPDAEDLATETETDMGTAEGRSRSGLESPNPDEVCPQPEPVVCPEVRLTTMPVGTGDGPCAHSMDCDPGSACIGGSCRPFKDVDVTLCVHQTAFVGPHCDGANLVHGVSLDTPRSGTHYDDRFPFSEGVYLESPSCAVTFANDNCFAVPLWNLIYDGVVASPLLPDRLLVPRGGWDSAFHQWHVGTRSAILERLDAGCFYVPERSTIGHRSTLSIWGPQ